VDIPHVLEPVEHLVLPSYRADNGQSSDHVTLITGLESP
jgi:hypothetical protein